ncbi:MAG: hypothetical protein IT425_14260 [Pirellulales bacterium]|nr:hypothetical protein [Pirellulales bacterium]
MIMRLNVVTLFVVLLTVARSSSAYDFLMPSDPIIAIDVDTPQTTPVSNYPGGEAPAKLIDGFYGSISVGNKYLNFGKAGTGFIVTPNGGASAIQSFTIWTANDQANRDPSSYEIWGTNDAIVSAEHSAGLGGEAWSFVSSGALSLPDTRNATSPVVSFTNASAYTSYKVIFPSIKNNSANSLQISELDAYTSNDATGTEVFAAGSPIRAMGVAFESNTPGGEGVANVINQDAATKYLNFGKDNTGFIVTPSYGSTVLNQFRITTANDAPERDPGSWILYGTNDAIKSRNHSHGDAEAWVPIDSGNLSLPTDRLTVSDPVTVNNTTAYTSYKLVFPTLRDSGAADSMQIGEIAFISPDDMVLQVNRQTGAASFEAAVSTTFKSYQVLSANGGFTGTGWTSIATTNADPDDAWAQTSPAGSHDTIAEEDTPTGANNGITIGSGNSYSVGTIWRILPTTFEDAFLTATGVDDAPIAVSVQYVGTPIPLGDYSGNGTVGPEDWPTFRAGYGGIYENVSLADAYLGGDLDGDFDSDLDDFNIFVNAAGGMGSLFGNQVPEPSSLVFLFGVVAGGLVMHRARRQARAIAVIAVAGLVASLTGSSTNAQSYTNVGNSPVGITIPTGQLNETETSGPEHFFDDTYLDDTPTTINDELFLLDYNDPNLNCPTCLQYAGQGGDPKTIFFDYGSQVSANWFAYSQRSGADPTADRVGKFEFWFSNTDFGGEVPVTPADAVVNILPTDSRLRDSVLRPYSLSGDRTGQYVAMRLTVSALSSNQGVNNIGGHEFRLLSGPGDVILQVDRSNGAMTLMNHLGNAQAIEMKSYKIESPLGGLDPVEFNGLRGDSIDFPAGNGTGNGWEIGGGSNAKRLVEGYFNGLSTLPTGTAGLSLGNAYNEELETEDLVFTWTNAAGELYDARVEYVGIGPNLPGDYNSDGIVDSADYVIWRKDPGSHGGDPDGYNTWRANFGLNGSGSGLGSSSGVPEPGVCVCVAVAGLLALCARGRSKFDRTVA